MDGFFGGDVYKRVREVSYLKGGGEGVWCDEGLVVV